jgi:uncharacterized coiled-coil DUF342 family protein
MEKNAYEQKAQAKIDELSAKVEVLNAKKDAAKADTKIEYEEKIKELNSLKNEIKEKFDNIKNSSDDAWKELKSGFEKSSKIMEDTINSALSKF